MPELFILHLEMVALSSLIVAIYALKRWFGLAPTYLTMGLLMAFVLIGSRLKVPAPAFADVSVRYSSVTHLSLVLVCMLLIYTLEGTREARRMLAAVGISSVLLYVLRWLLAARLVSSGVDLAELGRERWLEPELWSSLVSSAAFVASGVVLIVIYQFLYNKARWNLQEQQ